ncbi:MAG: HU family DNA-binding protein [Desulfobacteraceae bacterium]|nr:HU family DNA-binding protein [Desulfobacteraceae bacterium]
MNARRGRTWMKICTTPLNGLLNFVLCWRSREDILISGFGKFCVKDKNDRRGRNPSTGEDMMLGARRVVTFKCSRPLKQKLNGKGKKS